MSTYSCRGSAAILNTLEGHTEGQHPEFADFNTHGFRLSAQGSTLY